MIPKYNTSLLGLGNTTIWNGTSWNNGIPNKNTVAVIQGVYNTGTHGDISCLDLFLNSGSLTITINTIVKVFRNIQQQVGFVFNVTNGELALLDKDVDTSSIKITISKSLQYPMQRLDYRFLGDPISNKIVKTLSPGTLDNRINFLYNDVFVSTPPPNLNLITAGGDVANSVYKPGQGFSVRTPNNFPTSITTWTLSTNNLSNSGKLNSGIVKLNFEHQLIGDNTFFIAANPYSASIDINKFLSVNSFITGNLYFLKTNGAPGSSYREFNNFEININLQNFPKIGPFEGFLIYIPKNVSEDTEIIFTPDMMVVEEPFDLFSSFKLRLNQSGVNIIVGSSAYVLYKHPVNFINRSQTFSSTGYRLQLYNGEINSILLNSYEDLKEIPLWVAGTSANLTIQLSETKGLYDDYSIILVDKELEIEQDLKQGSYTFASNLEEYKNRFVIKIQ
jgi:hypothetical protein